MAQSKLSVVPAEQNSSPATAHLQLKRLRQALRDAQRRAADIGAVIARAEAVGRRAAEIRADRDRLERESTAPMSRWILAGALSEPPQLSAEAQLALDQSRRAADQAERDAQAVAETLPSLTQRQADLLALVPEIQKQIRETAARAVLEDARPLIELLREQRKATHQLELRLLGLKDLLLWRGMGTSNEFLELGDVLRAPSPQVAQSEISLAAREWEVMCAKLTGEE
ncbi:MAG: hypothetical protein ACYCUE_04920 [Steroidobacteraceae bacterium]